MIEQLMRTFPNTFTTVYNPTDPHYQWFKTAEGHIFGLADTTPSEQLTLITQLFERYETEEQFFRSSIQQRWYNFLFAGSDDIPFATTTTVRFYYVRTQQPIDETSFIEEAFQGAFERATWLTLSRTEGILIEENATADSVQLFQDVMQSLIGDMLIQFFSHIGQLHETNVHIQRQFTLEQQFFKTDCTTPHHPFTFFYEVFNRRCMTLAFKTDLLGTQLRQLLQQQETREMIHIFCKSNLNVSLAAKTLFVHRNSLQYRIDRLYQLTGIDIRDFSQAMFLTLAMQLIDNEA